MEPTFTLEQFMAVVRKYDEAEASVRYEHDRAEQAIQRNDLLYREKDELAEEIGKLGLILGDCRRHLESALTKNEELRREIASLKERNRQKIHELAFQTILDYENKQEWFGKMNDKLSEGFKIAAIQVAQENIWVHTGECNPGDKKADLRASKDFVEWYLEQPYAYKIKAAYEKAYAAAKGETRAYTEEPEPKTLASK